MAALNDLDLIDAKDENHLAKLGYHQELDRKVTFLGSVGITLGCMQPLLCAGVFYFGFGWGGPVSVVWGFVGVVIWSSFLALSLAEISSQYTVAGGPYYWAGALAGKLGRLPSYTLGWVLYLSYIGGIVNYEYQATQQLVAMRLMWSNGRMGTPPGMLGSVKDVPFGVPLPNVEAPDFQNAFFGIMVCFTVFHCLMNFLPVKYMNSIAICSFTWMCFVASVLMFALPGVTPKHAEASFVFGEFIQSSQNDVSATTLAPAPAPEPAIANSTARFGPLVNANVGMFTALPNDGWTAMVGLLMAQYLILVYDTPSHMAEETRNAGYTVPRAIMTAYTIGCSVNFGILLSYLHCLNLDNYQYDFIHLTPLQSKDNKIAAGNFLFGGVTNGLFPVGNIFYDSFMAKYGKAHGAVALTFMIFLGTQFTALLSFLCATRFLYSFARDGGLPFSKFFAKVEPKTGVPINCAILMMVSVISFSTAILTTNWFLKINAMASIVSNGLLFVYGVSPILRVVNRHIFKPAKEFNLGVMSIPCAVIGSLYCTFSVATIALPSTLPVEELNLNYAPVILGAVIVWSLVTFPFAGPIFNVFKGPALPLENITHHGGNMSEEAREKEAANGRDKFLEDSAGKPPVAVGTNMPADKGKE